MHPRKNVNGNNRLYKKTPATGFAPSARQQAAATESRTRVMLVDDHKMLREGLKTSLQNLGYEIVAEARNGSEAVDLAAAIRPEIILMDVTMPGIDGVEATRQIKERVPNIFIIILTMHSDQNILSEAIRAGANGYLVKDCSMGEIKSAIDSVVTGETVLSPHLAATVLAEVRNTQDKDQRKGRIITAREEEVLQLIADGCSTPEVAEQLYISQKTVKNHLASIYQKLDARDRTQAVLQAVRMGLVSIS